MLTLSLILLAGAAFSAVLSGCALSISDCPAAGQPQVDHENKDRFVQPGEQTMAGEGILNAAKKANETGSKSGHGLDYFKAADQILHCKLQSKPDDSKINKRSAEQVFSDGDASGCHDYAIVAAAMLRAMGYPVVFVDSVYNGFLNEPRGKEYSGHTFLEVFDPHCEGDTGCWILYDPTASKLYTNGYDPNNPMLPGGYVAFAKGIDPWTMQIKSNAELQICLDVSKDLYLNGKLATGLETNYIATDISRSDCN